jgi:protein CWC15
MTTAARPTFDPAKGGRDRGDLSVMSKQYSSRDLPGHTKLKYRGEGQGAPDEISTKDYRRELDEKESRSRKRTRAETNLDADDPVDSDAGDDANSESEDDEAELLAELARIKKERSEDMMKKDQEQKQQYENIRTENILTGNPLLQRPDQTGTASDFKVKRRWDDDVIFKNCAKEEEDKKSKGFVNDTLRSEFHKKFLSKYIK